MSSINYTRKLPQTIGQQTLDTYGESCSWLTCLPWATRGRRPLLLPSSPGDPCRPLPRPGVAALRLAAPQPTWAVLSPHAGGRTPVPLLPHGGRGGTSTLRVSGRPTTPHGRGGQREGGVSPLARRPCGGLPRHRVLPSDWHRRRGSRRGRTPRVRGDMPRSPVLSDCLKNDTGKERLHDPRRSVRAADSAACR